jgi:hypothetical protein
MGGKLLFHTGEIPKIKSPTAKDSKGREMSNRRKLDGRNDRQTRDGFHGERGGGRPPGAIRTGAPFPFALHNQDGA